LTGLGQRIKLHEIVDATMNSSYVISDQYQVTTFQLTGGDVISGRILAKDANKTTIASNSLKPFGTTIFQNADIQRSDPLPVSTMPAGLLNALNEEEVLGFIGILNCRW